jgi:apolipoprotein N-acyltransferase
VVSWPQRLAPSARWTLVCLSGLLNGLAFVWWGPAALLANVPLLVALRSAPSATAAALSGGLVGTIAGTHIYGILNYGWLLFGGFALYTGSQMVIYALVMRLCWGRVGRWLDVALPATVWALTEWVRTVGPLAMPASYVGCLADQAWAAPWLALAPHTGGLGVSTAVALVQSALFHLVAGERSHRVPALAALGLVAGIGVLGAVAPPDLGDRPLRVAGVQGGLANPQYAAARADPLAMRDVVRTYETLSQRAYASDAELVVWPETAVRAPVLDHADLRTRLFPPADSGATLIAGLLHEDRHGRSFNLAVVVAPGGETLGHYAKYRLVPNAESYLTAGEGWRPVDTVHGRVGVLICLESVYPDGARALAASGAELLVVMSNDAGFGRSPITHHMTNRATVRALETGRWLLRVGQAGVTTLIDPRGQPHGRLGLFEPSVLRAEARLRADQTLYVRWGDWWMLMMTALLAVTLARAWQRRALPPTFG